MPIRETSPAHLRRCRCRSAMQARLCYLLVLWCLLVPCGRGGHAEDSYRGEIRPLLARHCDHCHSGPEAEAELDFKRFTDHAAVLDDRGTWSRVLEILHARAMPPEGEPPLPKTSDRHFVRYQLEDPRRGGVLTLGGAHGNKSVVTN